MLEPKTVNAVADGAGNGVDTLAAGHIGPKPDTDQSAGLGNHRHGFVADIARTGAMPVETGMAHDQRRPIGHAERVMHRRFATVGHIDHDAGFMHGAHCVLAKRR